MQSERSIERAPFDTPERQRAAGLYGEVAVLPVRRAAPQPAPEPRTFR